MSSRINSKPLYHSNSLMANNITDGERSSEFLQQQQPSINIDRSLLQGVLHKLKSQCLPELEVFYEECVKLKTKLALDEKKDLQPSELRLVQFIAIVAQAIQQIHGYTSTDVPIHIARAMVTLENKIARTIMPVKTRLFSILNDSRLNHVIATRSEENLAACRNKVKVENNNIPAEQPCLKRALADSNPRKYSNASSLSKLTKMQLEDGFTDQSNSFSSTSDLTSFSESPPTVPMSRREERFSIDSSPEYYVGDRLPPSRAYLQQQQQLQQHHQQHVQMASYQRYPPASHQVMGDSLRQHSYPNVDGYNALPNQSDSRSEASYMSGKTDSVGRYSSDTGASKRFRREIISANLSHLHNRGSSCCMVGSSNSCVGGLKSCSHSGRTSLGGNPSTVYYSSATDPTIIGGMTSTTSPEDEYVSTRLRKRLGLIVPYPRKPKDAEYNCSVCNTAYQCIVNDNPWWAVYHHECPHCKTVQVPRIDISLVSNAIEIDPNVGALYGDGIDDNGMEGDSESDYGSDDGESIVGGESACVNNGGGSGMVEDGVADGDDVESVYDMNDDMVDAEEEKAYDGDGLLGQEEASKLLVLMCHSRSCTGYHSSPRHEEICRSTKFLMLHIRDCNGGNCMGKECRFAWCSPCKKLLRHLTRCTDPSTCGVCSPWSLPDSFKQLQSLNMKQTAMA